MCCCMRMYLDRIGLEWRRGSERREGKGRKDVLNEDLRLAGEEAGRNTDSCLAAEAGRGSEVRVLVAGTG